MESIKAKRFDEFEKKKIKQNKTKQMNSLKPQLQKGMRQKKITEIEL